MCFVVFGLRIRHSQNVFPCPADAHACLTIVKNDQLDLICFPPSVDVLTKSAFETDTRLHAVHVSTLKGNYEQENGPC